MARGRFRPISEKNYLINNAAATPSGTSINLVVVESNGGTGDNDVGIPARVKAIFIESSISVNTLGIGGTMALAIVKDIGGTSFAALNPNGVLSNITQQQMFYFIRMSPSQSNNPFRLFGWLKIPKRHQIFNEGDSLRHVMNVVTVGGSADWEHCTTHIYKHQKA